jgi:hypothetical protein
MNNIINKSLHSGKIVVVAIRLIDGGTTNKKQPTIKWRVVDRDRVWSILMS